MDAARPGALTPDSPADRLRGAGLRATRPRIAVLQALHDLGGHRSVDEIVSALLERGERLPRMTVYNAMRALVGAGLVMGADTGPGRALYEASDVWHHHFVCRTCGRVQDVPCVTGRRPCLDASLEGAEIDEAQVIFRGLCEDCVPN